MHARRASGRNHLISVVKVVVDFGKENNNYFLLILRDDRSTLILDTFGWQVRLYFFF